MGESLRIRLEQSKDFDNAALEAMINVMVVACHFNECNDRICARFGITRSQYNVLRILRGAHPGGHPRQEVTRRMVDRSPDVTRLIDRLEATGFVERERTDTDRRLSIARITQKGLDLLDSMDPDFDRLTARIGQQLRNEELLELSRLCEALYSVESTPA